MKYMYTVSNSHLRPLYNVKHIGILWLDIRSIRENFLFL
jgi:hypothetical protein